MAISLTYNSQLYNPSDNELIYQFQSDKTTEVNFSFIVRTFMNGMQVSTDRVFPMEGTRAYFDASKIAKYNVSSPSIVNAIDADAGTLKTIYVTVTEEYGATPTEHLTAQSVTTNVWKACFPNNSLSGDYEGYFVEKRFLTNAPRSTPILALPYQDVILTMLTYGTNIVGSVTAYDSLGNVLGVYSSTNSYKVRQFNLRRSLVAVNTGSSVFDIAYAEVKVGTSETLTVKYITDHCFDIYSLVWMNHLGSFDTFVFEHNNKLSGDVKLSSYVKKLGNWETGGYKLNVSNSGVKGFTSNQTDKGVLYTDYIPQDQQHFLTELYKSPQVFLYSTDGFQKQPINITRRSFEKYQDRFEELYSEEVNYELSTAHKGLTI